MKWRYRKSIWKSERRKEREELNPCPFCGGKGVVKAVNKSYGFTIWCACECGARTEGFFPDTNKEDDTMENIEKCKERAIEAWNRRANDETDLCR